MASGVITGSSNSYVYLKISWSSTAGTGGSTVNASLIAQNGTHAYWYATINKTYSITIDGTKTTGSGAKLSSTQGGKSTLMSASKWVSYTGNKSITISGYADFNEVSILDTGTTLGTRSVSGTATLDKVGSKPPVTTVSAPTTSTISETATSINVSWSKVTDYSGKATYTVQLSENGGSYTTVKSGIANGTTSYTHTITAGQGNTYVFRVCAVNDVGPSDYSYSGTVTTNKLNPPTIGNLGVFNPYVNSTYNVPLSGGSQTNGAAFKRRANIHVNGAYKYTGNVPSNNGNTSVDIVVGASNIIADLPSNAYSSSTIFTVVAWTENSNGTRSGYVSKAFTVNINTDGGAAPKLSAPTISGGAFGHSSTCFIAGVSALTVTMGNATLNRGAKSCNLELYVSGYGSTTLSSKTYNNLTAGVKTITFKATDNRGLSASYTTEIRVQSYAPPTIRNIKGVRLSSPNTSAKVTYEQYYTPIYAYSTDINTAGIQLNGINSQQYSINNGTWNNYTSGNEITDLSTGNTHTIGIRVADKVKTSTYISSNVLIPTIVVPFAFRRNRIGINCIPQNGYALDINGALRVGSNKNVVISEGSVSATGNISTNGALISNVGAVELYGSTPFIDFHYGNTSDDYNVRLINNASGVLKLVGNLNISGVVYQDSVTINSWGSMGLCRGDSTYINVYLNGVYVGKKGDTLKSSGTIKVKIGNTTYELTSPTITQRDYGVEIVSRASGYGDIGSCVFTTSFTISK